MTKHCVLRNINFKQTVLTNDNCHIFCIKFEKGKQISVCEHLGNEPKINDNFTAKIICNR